MRTSMRVLALCAIGLTLAACGGADSDDDAASVKFDNLTDGQQVTSPVNVCLSAEYIKIEPKGAVVAGSGHHHIVVDATDDELASLQNAGVVIPADETHIHMGDGSACTDVTLTPGKHKLTAVVADGAHMTLSPPVMASVEVDVTP